MKCITEFSVHPSGSVLYFLYADPPSLSVNSAVNGTLPCLRALFGSDELLLHKAGRSCLLEKRMNYILLCLSSLSIQDKALLFWPFLTALSQRPWTTTKWKSRVAELWCKRLLCGIFMSRTNRDWSHLCYHWFCFSKQICYKTGEAEITHDDAASLGCTKTTDQTESQVRVCVSAGVCSMSFYWVLFQSTRGGHSKKCFTHTA